MLIIGVTRVCMHLYSATGGFQSRLRRLACIVKAIRLKTVRTRLDAPLRMACKCQLNCRPSTRGREKPCISRGKGVVSVQVCKRRVVWRRCKYYATCPLDLQTVCSESCFSTDQDLSSAF